MKQLSYMSIFIAMLVLLAVTFYYQIKTFGGGNQYQWYLLAVIVLVGIGSYYLSKKMKEEKWFKKLPKRK